MLVDRSGPLVAVILREIADGQMAGVTAAEGIDHVAYGGHLALTDADGSGEGRSWSGG